MNNDIAVAVIAFLGTLAGSYFSQRKTTALIVYRLDELEKKMNKHNSLVEKVYCIEKNQTLMEEKIKVANHRIDDLERMEI